MTAITDNGFARVDKNSIIRDFNITGALTGADIAYSATETLNEKIDAKQDTLSGLTASVTELNYTDGVTSSIQTQLDGKQATISGLTASGAELNILDGATLSTTELNYVDGVTSAIQPQLDGKQGELTITTTGTSGPATLIGDTLNIPQYSGGGGGSGDVVGPASSTDNALARFDSTTGKLLQNGVVTESDDGSLANVNSIILDTTHTGTPVEGEMYWDDAEKTVSVRTGLDDVTLQIGREMHKLCRNNTGSTITNGSVVYINGAGSAMPTIALAQANDYTKSIKTIGVATMDILTGNDGLVTTMGYVHDLNTSGFSAGDILYLSNSVSGGITNVNPTGLNYTLEIGMCIISDSTVGIIDVHVKALRAVESDEFKVVDSTDKTKQVAFNVAGVSSGVKRTLTVPNADTTIIGTTTTDTLTNKSISLGTNTVTTTKAQLNTAVTDGDVVFLDSADTITGVKTFGAAGNVGKLKVAGTTSGSATIDAPAVAGAAVITLPGVTSTLATLAGTETLTNKTLTTPVLNGTPTGTGVATAATASTLALRDANGNLNFNNWVGAYTSTVTSAGTLTLTVSSSNLQRFSGTTTHTVTLPVATTLAVGHQYEFINDSTGSITINSSGANLVYTLPAGFRVFVTCILNSGTTAASWTTDVIGASTATGTGALVFATSPTLVTPALGTPSALVATNATGTATGLTSGITNALKSATTTVDVSAATAPSSGQVLTATSSTTATWQTPSGGGSKQFRITIPGELVADTGGYQGLFFYNDTGATITISNVGVFVSKAGTTCSVNVYKSSGTAADGLDTSAVNLFTSAIALGSGYTSATNTPNTTTVESGRWVTGRVTSVAGAPANLQIIITYS